MALVSITTPGTLVATSNEVDVLVQVQNMFTSDPNLSAYILNISNAVSGSNFELILNNRVLAFTAKQTPELIGYEYKTNATIDDLIEMFKQCAPLAEAFDISKTELNINLRLRNEIEILEVGNKNLAVVSLESTNTSKIVSNNSRIKLLVADYKDTNSEIVGALSNNPSPGIKQLVINGNNYIEGVSNFDISSLLNREKYGYFSFPDEDSDILTTHDLCTKHKIIAIGVSGTPPIPVCSNEIDIYSFPAGFDEMKLAELHDLNKNFDQYLSEQQMFLTQHRSKKTDVYSTERLFYLAQAAGTIGMYAKKYYTDNTFKTEKISEIPVTKYQIVELRSGYNAIKTALDSGKTIRKYEVFLKNEIGSSLTYNFEYILDFTYQSWARYFMYRNKLGGYDLFRTTGKLSNKPKTEKTFAKIKLPSNFVVTDPTKKQINNTKSNNYVINSGYIPFSERSYFDELIDSPEVYWLMNGFAYPIYIHDNESLSYEDNTTYSNADFEFEMGLSTIIPLEPSPILPICVNGDFDIDFDSDFDI